MQNNAEICPLVPQSVENCVSELCSSVSDFCHIGEIITVSVRCVKLDVMGVQKYFYECLEV